MKRLLLISYVFPPEPTPGALRPSYLARYLPNFGWEATVLTHSIGRPPFDADVVRAADVAEPMSRLPYRVQDALLFPDTTARWIPRAVAAGNRLLAAQRFDAILGTALPASVHVVGSALARGSGLPWIADYRDPWNGNAYVRRGVARRSIERSLERRLLRRARAITTISEPIARQLRALHEREVSVLPNARDPAEWDSIPHAPPAGFDLVYTGSMYDGKRSPDLLFRALAELRGAGEAPGTAARVHFYGPNSDSVGERARAHGVSDIVLRHGVVPRRAAMTAQAGAAALLIFLNMDAATSDELGSKFLEYVGSRRPILAFGPAQSALRDVIARNGLGWFASDLAQARSAVRDAYAHFARGSADLKVDPQAFPIARELARRFALVLDAALNGADCADMAV